jgi:hypothetical protein
MAIEAKVRMAGHRPRLKVAVSKNAGPERENKIPLLGLDNCARVEIKRASPSLDVALSVYRNCVESGAMVSGPSRDDVVVKDRLTVFHKPGRPRRVRLGWSGIVPCRNGRNDLSSGRSVKRVLSGRRHAAIAHDDAAAVKLEQIVKVALKIYRQELSGVLAGSCPHVARSKALERNVRIVRVLMIAGREAVWKVYNLIPANRPCVEIMSVVRRSKVGRVNNIFPHMGMVARWEALRLAHNVVPSRLGDISDIFPRDLKIVSSF